MGSWNPYSLANQERCYVVKESTVGTLAKPSSTNQIYTVGVVSFEQELELFEDEQVRSGASQRSKLKGRYMPGTWSFTTYVKPSGTKGTAPEHDVLFECLAGTKTTNAGTSVVYTPADDLSTFSLWVKKGHTVFAMKGCSVEQAEFTVSGDDLARINWSGGFMDLHWAGTSELAEAISASQNYIKVKHSQRFKAGMYIQTASENNGGNGFQITNVIHYPDGTGKLVISPDISSGSAGEAVTPWYPSAGTEVGQPIHGKLGIATVDNVNMIILSGTVTIKNNIKYYIDEKNGQLYATNLGRPGRREVTGEVLAMFAQPFTSYFYRSRQRTQDALVLPAGDTAGYIMELSFPYVEWEFPGLSGDEEVQVTLGFTAVASASLNDEFTITFK